MGIESRAAAQPQPAFPKFTVEELRKDVFLNREVFGRTEIEHASPHERRKLLHQYVNYVDAFRVKALQHGLNRGDSPLELLLANSMYRAEIVRARGMFDVNRRLLNFRQNNEQSVLWQNAATEYIMKVNQKLPEHEARRTLAEFWKAQDEIIMLAPSRHERDHLREAADRYRNGILRVVSLATVLSDKGCEVRHPSDPEDDTKLKIDVIVRSKRGNNLLVQIKPPEALDPSEPFLYEVISPLDSPPQDPELHSFWQGIRTFTDKYHLDPDTTRGVYAGISAHQDYINKTSGVPKGTLRTHISESFSEIDRGISTQLLDKLSTVHYG